MVTAGRWGVFSMRAGRAIGSQHPHCSVRRATPRSPAHPEPRSRLVMGTVLVPTLRPGAGAGQRGLARCLWPCSWSSLTLVLLSAGFAR